MKVKDRRTGNLVNPVTDLMRDQALSGGVLYGDVPLINDEQFSVAPVEPMAGASSG